VKEPGAPRSLEGWFRAWHATDERLRRAWWPLGVWFGSWWAATAASLVWQSELPFLLVGHTGLLLTPFVVMAVLWRAVRKPGQAGDPGRGALTGPPRPPTPSS
jgi:hypothetical protein